MGKTMPSPFKKISDANWVNWEDLVERVRTAKTTEVAVARLQKELDMVLSLREGSSAREAVEDYKLSRKMKEGMLRVQDMSKAMAYREGETSDDFIELAIRIDYAIAARKKHET